MRNKFISLIILDVFAFILGTTMTIMTISNGFTIIVSIHLNLIFISILIFYYQLISHRSKWIYNVSQIITLSYILSVFCIFAVLRTESYLLKRISPYNDENLQNYFNKKKTFSLMYLMLIFSLIVIVFIMRNTKGVKHIDWVVE